MREALVLTFHAIGSTGLPGETLSSPADMRYALEPGSFEYVLSLLAPEKVVTAGELSGKESGRWVALTFDDGFVTDYSEAFPRLKSAGLRATFYVTAKKIGEKGYTD
jgi:peptidoglycan/xylan/chitin deacetylase (PgdA/CDA1 family)